MVGAVLYVVLEFDMGLVPSTLNRYDSSCGWSCSLRHTGV